jgi:hypothetical protein
MKSEVVIREIGEKGREHFKNISEKLERDYFIVASSALAAVNDCDKDKNQRYCLGFCPLDKGMQQLMLIYSHHPSPISHLCPVAG